MQYDVLVQEIIEGRGARARLLWPTAYTFINSLMLLWNDRETKVLTWLGLRQIFHSYFFEWGLQNDAPQFGYFPYVKFHLKVLAT
jgi:hypothetical protein